MTPRALILVLALLGAGCAPRSLSTPPAGGAGAQPIELHLPPADFAMAATLSQSVAGSFNGKRQTLRFEVELTAEKLVMVALTEIGLPVFSVTYDGETAEVTPYMKSIPLPPPAWILGDFLIANAPETALRAALAKTDYRMETGPALRRIVGLDGSTAVLVRYSDAEGNEFWGRDLVLENSLLHYRLEVTTLAKTQRTVQP